MNYLLVGIAGIIGAILRYLLGVSFNHWWFHDFPLATFITNMLGCFILGWFTHFLPRLNLHPHLITALGTGLIGAFTTFSTFSVETVHLITIDKWGTALLYVLLSLFCGILFSWGGYQAGTNGGKDIKASSKNRGEQR
ncbi:fluoride efflux transporter CrcB [Neobacillus cucumis]|uniref:fluoride efflux transporter CrcB n=1 Tax=Neobacillus cucumis TaxID=1740721 RepID=UPI00196252CC|nr:fluoride efflux transporter CrcB [Neobacillus cucumis]MBM7651035.1 CrcB protein [Neobacillus cucumis]